MSKKFELVLFAFLVGACDSDRPREPAPPPKVSPPPAVTADDNSYRFPSAERVIAIGDIHGDADAARAALRLAGAIGPENDWTGDKLVVVQTGDLLDRGDQEPEVIELFEHLAEQAKKAGGAVHVLDGNHEFMNAGGDFRYVTPGGFHRFEGTSSLGAPNTRVDGLPADERGRARAFFPGGPMAKRLAEHPVAIVVGDTVFVHGGILPEHARYGIGKINAEARRYMLGESATLPPILAAENAPTWTREYSEGVPSEQACSDLKSALEILHAKRMVVGHTPQKGISSGCDAKVWRIDVGLSHFYGGKPEVLEIKGDSVHSLQAEAAPASSAKGGKNRTSD